MITRRVRVLLLILMILTISWGAFFWWMKEPVSQGKSLSQWLAVLDEGEQKETAKQALRQIASKSVPTLRRLLRERDSQAKQKFLTWLASIRWLHYEHLSVFKKHRRAIAACAVLGPLARRAAPDLAGLLSDEEASSDAAAALAAVGPDGVTLLMEAAVHGSNLLARTSAIWALNQHSDGSGRGVPLLMTLLRDPEPLVRAGAVLALGTFTNPPPAFSAALAQALEDPDHEVQLAAVQIALKMNAPNQLALLRAVNHINPNGMVNFSVPAGVIATSPDLINDTELSTKDLLARFSDPSVMMRRTSVMLLSFQTNLPDLVVPALAKALNDRDKSVRSAAAWVLGRYGTSAASAIPALEKALLDPDDEVQRQAQAALKSIRPTN